ncbi:MAG: LptF/LptG family permease [Alphaproteobacteria bacterium]|nr:LptF/LptG family permease [Alphaproteobacteria bacterium]
MKTLSIYFARQILVFFIMLLLVLAGLAWMMHILTMLKFLIQYGIGIFGFLGLTAMMLPLIISIIMPFSVFISVVFLYSRLISDREITVAAAAGLSPMQIARPALWFAGAVTAIHFAMNMFVVPITQVKFYDTQWEMRYGLAHLKLQEATFTQMARGLVVFVENVAGNDLSKLMLYDNRDQRNQMTISADNGKLIHTSRGLSMVMTLGSVQFRDDNFAVGTFDSMDMDMNLADREQGNVFRVSRLSSAHLVHDATHLETFSDNNRKRIITELSTRFLGPFMNLILALIAMTMLLKSSLLRRSGFNMAAPMATFGMAAAMAAFMILSDLAVTLSGFFAIAGGQAAIVIVLFFILSDKKLITKN